MELDSSELMLNSVRNFSFSFQCFIYDKRLFIESLKISEYFQQ